MAITIVCAHIADQVGRIHRRLFLSNPYCPVRKLDPHDNLVTEQEWQHPDPTTLRYKDLGALETVENTNRLLQAIIELGAHDTQGNVRVIRTTDLTIVADRLQNWEEWPDQEAA